MFFCVCSTPVFFCVSSVACVSSVFLLWLKQVRAPVWQTLPSPSRTTFTRTVSSSQSAKMLDNSEAIAGRFSLHPQLAAGPAEERRESGGDGHVERLLVHESHHQHLRRAFVLDDGRDQSVELCEIHNGTKKMALLVFLQQGREVAFRESRSVHTQINRPAGAGVVVPVMMQRSEHLNRSPEGLNYEKAALKG